MDLSPSKTYRNLSDLLANVFLTIEPRDISSIKTEFGFTIVQTRSGSKIMLKENNQIQKSYDLLMMGIGTIDSEKRKIFEETYKNLPTDSRREKLSLDSREKVKKVLSENYNISDPNSVEYIYLDLGKNKIYIRTKDGSDQIRDLKKFGESSFDEMTFTIDFHNWKNIYGFKLVPNS